MATTYTDSGLATLDEKGRVPDSRMTEAEDVQAFVRRLWNADEQRARKRDRVRGLVDGNPPYNAARLREANRADAANVNWGTGRMYMESGAGAFYDLFSEAPGCVAIQTSFGESFERQVEYGRVMSAQADRILLTDKDWDFHIQNSINEMTLHGCGPLMFEDCYRVLPKSISCGSLKVPEMTPATTSEWEVSSVDVDYYPPKLYEFIQDEEKAKQAGWNVPYVKTVIQNAARMMDENGRPHDWEWCQNQLKNNSLTYTDDSKVCKLAFVFWKEFDGKVTLVIVERQTTADTDKVEFLFKHVGWYEDFHQCLHPMYFDRGNGGFHHSVTGLGVKMYGAMEYENRLLCNLMDKAFAPKIFFKLANADTKERMQIARYGDWGLLPSGAEAVQAPIQGFLTDGLAMWQASGQLMRSNLSSYRQQVPTKTEGNPATARQVTLEASQMASLSKTSYARFYRQLDLLYAEIVRRLCLRTSTDKRAKEFQKRCIAAGVPEECFDNIDKVEAMRIIGQGSGFLRRDAVVSIAAMAGSLPEDGRNNWLNDFIAAHAGGSAVSRYNPQPKQQLATDQQAEALQWVGSMKVGIPPIVTSSQNPVTYATTFLNAAVQSLQSLQQGGNPQEVLAFLQICGPAIMAQAQRFANDPVRKPIYDQIMAQWKQLATTTDKLQAQIKQMVQARTQQQQKTQAALNDQQIKTMKAQNDIALKQVKTKAQLATQSAKTKQQLALADAQTASKITRETQEQMHGMAMAERETEAAEQAASQSSE